MLATWSLLDVHAVIAGVRPANQLPECSAAAFSWQQCKRLGTGEVEVLCQQLDTLNRARPYLPFLPRDYQQKREPLRLRHRYLDLRSSEMQHRLRFRSDLLLRMRLFLARQCGEAPSFQGGISGKLSL
ncbi:hypothetical protein V5799_026702 [Amblyomma americanum]|uniref:Secreted protein n=1 Tax=Amblyomma americanum TaxID=6943 RepID=A0AAQ4DHT9_AMBAM